MKFSVNLHLRYADAEKCATDLHIKGKTEWQRFDSLEELTSNLKATLFDEHEGVYDRMLQALRYTPHKGILTGSVKVSGVPPDQHGTERGDLAWKDKCYFDDEGDDMLELENALEQVCRSLEKSLTDQATWDDMIPAKGPQRKMDDYLPQKAKEETLTEEDIDEAGISSTYDAPEPEDDREPEEADEDDLDYGGEQDESEMEEETAAVEETREEEKPIEEWTAEELRTYMLEHAIEGSRLRKADMIEAIQESWDLLEDD